MGGWLNGGLEAIVATAKRLWWLGGIMLVAMGWFFTVNSSVSDVREIKKNVALLPAIQQYQRDSLTTDSETKFILGQMLATVRKMDNRLRRIEGRPIQETLGRWEYFEQYGPIPPRYKDWFEAPSEWLDAKAGTRHKKKEAG